MLRPEDCKPGVLVECIATRDPMTPLRVGEVYSVRALVWNDFMPGIQLEEVEVNVDVRGPNIGFLLALFRLLPSGRAELLRSLLEPTPFRMLEGA